MRPKRITFLLTTVYYKKHKSTSRCSEPSSNRGVPGRPIISDHKGENKVCIGKSNWICWEVEVITLYEQTDKSGINKPDDSNGL